MQLIIAWEIPNWIWIEIEAEVELEEPNLSKLGDEERIKNIESDGDLANEVVTDTEIKYNVINKSNQPFYSLEHTNSKLMFNFMDLLREQKYLWSEENRKNSNFKAEPMESAQRITKVFALRSNGSANNLQCVKTIEDFARVIRRIIRYFSHFYQLQYIYCDECKQTAAHYDTCHMGFSHASKLRLHRNRFHERTTRWQCNLSSYCTPNKWDLQSHPPTLSGERNYQCVQCGINTKSRSALAVHRRTHLAVKTIKCAYCARQYHENYLLKCHLKKMHSDETLFN